MSSACSFILMQIKVIFIRMVSHLNSVWNRGARELGNGLFDLHENDKIFSYEWFCTKTHFGREAKGNLEMAHSFQTFFRSNCSLALKSTRESHAQSDKYWRHSKIRAHRDKLQDCLRLGLYICYFPYLQYDVLTWDWLIWSKLISNHRTGPKLLYRRIIFALMNVHTMNYVTIHDYSQRNIHSCSLLEAAWRRLQLFSRNIL